MPLEEAPQLNLVIEVVNSSPLSETLPASTTTHQIFDDVTFPGMFDAMVYFEGHKGSMCFSASDQISEFQCILIPVLVSL